MKLKLSEIKPNPFRCKISGGFDEKQIGRIIESYKMSDFGKEQRYEARQNNGHYELVYGHHRRAATLKHYGNDVLVDVVVRDYNDEQMFVEMIRENMTKDNVWFTRMQAFRAAKKWLETSATRSTSQTKPHVRKDQGIGSRRIAEFLSKDGKSVTHDEVTSLLRIGENLDPSLLRQVTKGSKSSGNNFGLNQAAILSGIKDKQEQKDLAVAIKKSPEQRVRRQSELITKYKESPEDIKKAVREGRLDLTEIGLRRPEGEKTYNVFDIEKITESLDLRQIFYNLEGAGKLIKKYPLRDMPEKAQEIMGQVYSQFIKILLAEVEGKEEKE